MKCEEFEARLNLVLDERRRPEWDAELREHSAACGRCRELAHAYGLLLDGFYALKTPQPSADLAQRVLEDFQVRPAATRRRTLVAAALATAAAVAFAVYLPWRNADAPVEVAKIPPAQPHFAAKPAQPVTAQPADAQPAAAQPAEAKLAEAAGSDDSVDFDWQDLGDLPLIGPALVSGGNSARQNDAYAALAKGTGQGLASVVLSIPGLGRPGSVWPAQVSPELRPVTESVTETFNLLLQSFPFRPAPPAPPRAS